MSCTVNLHRPAEVSVAHFGSFSSLTISSSNGDYVSIFFDMKNHVKIVDAMAEAFNTLHTPEVEAEEVPEDDL